MVAVHHGSAALDAAGMPGPTRPWEALFRAWLRHAYAPVDAIASVVDPQPDCGREASFPLRLGLHDAFRPQTGVARGDHVLYVGRLAREKGVFRLLEAAARSDDPWPLRLIGSGPAEDALRRRARALGIARRVAFQPFVSDRGRLARAYAGARCVVMPGEHETFGLVALEAAASGARVVACTAAPSAGLLGDLAHRFAPGDTDGLATAIAAARAARVGRGWPRHRGCSVLAAALGPALRRGARRPARAGGMRRDGSIAVALHDVEPATFERCALIRDWLDDHGIERVTLLVIPAPDLHPFNDRRPEMVQWLADCAGRGDAIAQHGFQHRASAAAPRRSNPAAEFLGLDGEETRRAVEAGRRVLRLAGVRPRGFVAPGLRLHRRAARDARRVLRLVGEPVAHLRAGALDAGAGADPRHLERREAPGVAMARAGGGAGRGGPAAPRPPSGRPRPSAPHRRRGGGAPACAPPRPPRRHLRRPRGRRERQRRPGLLSRSRALLDAASEPIAQLIGATWSVVDSVVSAGMRILPLRADFGHPRGRPRSNGPAMYCVALPELTLANVTSSSGSTRGSAQTVAVDRERRGDRVPTADVRAGAVDAPARLLPGAGERVGREDVLGGRIGPEDLGLERGHRLVGHHGVAGDRLRAGKRVGHGARVRIVRVRLALVDVPLAERVVGVLVSDRGRCRVFQQDRGGDGGGEHHERDAQSRPQARRRRSTSRPPCTGWAVIPGNQSDRVVAASSAPTGVRGVTARLPGRERLVNEGVNRRLPRRPGAVDLRSEGLQLGVFGVADRTQAEELFDGGQQRERVIRRVDRAACRDVRGEQERADAAAAGFEVGGGAASKATTTRPPSLYALDASSGGSVAASHASASASVVEPSCAGPGRMGEHGGAKSVSAASGVIRSGSTTELPHSAVPVIEAKRRNGLRGCWSGGRRHGLSPAFTPAVAPST